LKKYDDEADDWAMRINVIEETLEPVCQNLMNEFVEKDEIIDTLQMDIQSSFYATFSHPLLATHDQLSHEFEKHTKGFSFRVLHQMDSDGLGEHGQGIVTCIELGRRPEQVVLMITAA
jgi:hypothetical protein